MTTAAEARSHSLPLQQQRLSSLRKPALHLQAVWRDCRQTAESLRNADALKHLCLRICDELHLSVLSNAFFQFEPGGVTGTILLGDSHIALHTWPDRHMLKADIRLPSGDGDALLLFEKLESCFQPAHSSLGHRKLPVKALS